MTVARNAQWRDQHRLYRQRQVQQGWSIKGKKKIRDKELVPGEQVPTVAQDGGEGRKGISVNEICCRT